MNKSDLTWLEDNSLRAAQEMAVGHLVGRLAFAQLQDEQTLKECLKLVNDGIDNAQDKLTYWAEVCRVNDELMEMILDKFGFTKLQLWDYIQIS